MNNYLTHIQEDISRGNQLLKTPSYLYFISHKIEKKYNACSSLNNLCTSIIYLTASKDYYGKHLASYSSIQAPISLRYFSRNHPPINQGNPHPKLRNPYRSFSDSIHHLYNLDNYTTDSTFPLNSNLNWVTHISCMHELIMVDLSFNWSYIEASPLLDLLLVPPTIGTSLTDFNLVKLN